LFIHKEYACSIFTQYLIALLAPVVQFNFGEGWASKEVPLVLRHLFLLFWALFGVRWGGNTVEEAGEVADEELGEEEETVGEFKSRHGIHSRPNIMLSSSVSLLGL